MPQKSTDTRFFTNDEGGTLLDRFKKTLEHVDKFDVLVGYFRSSGFYLLQKELEKVNKIRILNGIDVDKKIYDAHQQSQLAFDHEATSQLNERISNSIQEEWVQADDNHVVYEGSQKFIEYLKNGKIELRQHPSHKLHAKVYICRFGKPVSDVDYGRVITGSSNFSHSGLQGNLEFNVELKDKTDVDFSLNQFEKLWDESDDIKNLFIQTIQNKTWLNNKIIPYELYLKTLFEYFNEDIDFDKKTDFKYPEDYMNLEYQKQAVVSANKILDAYNGVFIADVVGLGKTYVAALLSQQPNLKSARKLFIVPPVLQDYWEETLAEFEVLHAKVESAGKIKSIKNWDKLDEVEYVFIDEAHRFRNEDTETWKELYENICFGKKIILITATAINNKFADILSQLKLFQRPNRSNIPTVRNLQYFFKSWENKVKKAKSVGPKAYMNEKRKGSKEIREKVLKHVMIRRTRKEIEEYFSKDLDKQNLKFPKISNPNPVIYEFDSETEQAFNETVELIRDKFKKARYTPYLYLIEKPTDFEITRQKNLGNFMKTMLVKRLESSFHAFKKSIARFIESHENFISMINSGRVLISKTLNVYELMDEDNDEKIKKLIEEGKDLKEFKSSDFVPKFLKDIHDDLDVLLNIQNLWKDIKKDPKISKLISILKNNNHLKNNKIVMFTESAETGMYLLKNLSQHFKSEVLFYSSQGGYLSGHDNIKKLNQKDARLLIRKNYDPMIKKEKRKDDIRILISTDVLAEGINLHRSNINLNYDLPWNPIRVIQRTGRINRVGTDFDNLYIFNFFPTEKSDSEIKQKTNIISKIQAFHDCLGSDTKFLTETEEVETFNLFGSNLYESLNKKETYEEKEDLDTSELKYLNVIRDVRDKNPELYGKIQLLPKKSRSARKSNIQDISLVSFFRKGRLKKFLLSNKKDNLTNEITFIDAIKFLECDMKLKRENLNKDFFDLLQKNKLFFNEMLEKIELVTTSGKGVSIEKELIKDLKYLAKQKVLRDEDQHIRARFLNAFEDGIIARVTAKKIKKEIDSKNLRNDPIKLLNAFIKNISKKFIDQKILEKIAYGGKREIILSGYLLKE